MSRAFLIVAAAGLGLVATSGGCKKDEGRGDPEATAEGAPGTAAADPCAGATHETGALRWFEDDVAAARACAAARGLPVVLDLWAPWCHTCLSMQSYVFTDPALAPLADRFVFAAADTDRAQNAEAVERYPLSAWPTFYVIGTDGEVHGRFVGAATVEQFRDFLVQSEQSYLAGADLPAGSPLAELVAADRAVAAALGRPTDDPARAAGLSEAEARYRAALAAAPADWPRRPDVLVSLVGALRRRGDHVACVDLAMQEMANTGPAASATDFIVNARDCADAIELTDPTRPDAFRRAAAERLAQLVADPAAPMSADDRSDAMMNLRGLYDELGRPADAVAIAEQQRAMLADAAAKAPTPLAAMTYAWPRAEVHAYLKDHAALVPWLEELAAKLPQEYDPPYRLAWLYQDAGEPAKALPWAKQAQALGYGPRKERISKLVAEIEAALAAN